VSPALLLAGVQRENYRVLALSAAEGRPVEREGEGWLCLCVGDGTLWPLLRLPLARMGAAARRMRTVLIELSRRCEGFHLVEHLLLRPRGGAAADRGPAGLHDHRLSVILPAFTARFADPNCRAWIEELIAQHLPAHLLPQFFWLDFPLLAQFEQRHAAWQALLRDHLPGAAADALNGAARDVLDFLDKNARYQSGRVWT
jgi:hypothetical protein